MRTASLAVRNGYERCFVYREGLPDWERHGYPVESDVTYPAGDVGTVSGEQLKAMLDAGEDLVVLDIRDQVDFGVGRIGGSLNIPLDDMHERWRELPRQKRIVLVDRHGKQVRTSARYLAYRGLENTVMLEKGFVDGWQKLGYQVAEGP